MELTGLSHPLGKLGRMLQRRQENVTVGITQNQTHPTIRLLLLTRVVFRLFYHHLFSLKGGALRGYSPPLALLYGAERNRKAFHQKGVAQRKKAIGDNEAAGQETNCQN